MSISKVWNAAIAIIEERPADAREILRQEEIPTGPLQARLISAVRAVASDSSLNALMKVLQTTLRLEPQQGVDKASYYQGVADAEKVVEDVMALIREKK